MKPLAGSGGTRKSDMKAKRAHEAQKLEHIPNVGPAMIRDFHMLGIREPKDLKNKDAYALYKKMCTLSGKRQDPCVLDTYMAAVDFMKGAPARPWYSYTKKRKKEYPGV